MNVKLTPRQEQIVKAELDAGRFGSVEELIGAALEGLRERDASQSSSGTDRNGAVREMLLFVEQNRVELKGLTVKQLIDEGHRL